MKSQKHNQGQLKELKVMLESELVEALQKMSEKTKMSQADIVAIALKRFRASHADYEDKEPRISS